MASVSLGCYTMRSIERNSGEFFPLGELLADFTDYLRNRSETWGEWDSNGVKYVFQVLDYGKDSDLVYGRVKYGEYGYASLLVDAETKEVSHIRITSEAEVFPFYFLAYLPADRSEGIMLLQTRSSRGIRGALLNDFIRHLKDQDLGKRVEINPLMPIRLFKQAFGSGGIKKVTYTKFSWPSSTRKSYDRGVNPEEVMGRVEMSFIAERGTKLPMLERLGEILEGKRNANELIEIREGGYDKVKVEVEINGKTRTFDLSSNAFVRPNIDITEDISIDQDGHPTFDSIDRVARDLLKDLIRQIRV